MFKTVFFFFSILFSFYGLKAQTFKKIPDQKLPLYEIIDSCYQPTTSNKTTDSISFFEIPRFEISNFITYSEYKKYLASIKTDSSNSYYLSQLPDSNIATDVNVYLEYLHSSKYDQYPVLGISWNNAMNYCSWKNQMENISDTANGAYRLPNTSEWISAYLYFEKQHVENDLNDKYSDWLLSSYSESANEFLNDDYNFGLNYVFQGTKKDAPVYHRKRFIGNSFLYDHEFLLGMNGYGYDFTGYRHVGFRMVKGKSINTFKHRLRK